MSEKVKAYGCFLLALLGAFNIGCYVTSVRFEINTIHPHQWVLTSIFMLYFLLLGIDKIKQR